MSSLRNAVKRITHKERAQPQARSHLGILEKKKDYRIRARDFHNKQDRIRSLREKAAQRNPDEFYFGMHRSKVKDGKHRKTEEAWDKAICAATALAQTRCFDFFLWRLFGERSPNRARQLAHTTFFQAPVCAQHPRPPTTPADRAPSAARRAALRGGPARRGRAPAAALSRNPLKKRSPAP